MHTVRKNLKGKYLDIVFLFVGFAAIVLTLFAIQRPQSVRSSAQEFPVHASSVKTSLQGTTVALDAKNLEKYLVVESAILGVTDNISLYFQDANADKTISIDPTRSWIPASTIKAYVAVEAFRQQRIGLITFDQPITVQAQNVVTTEMETNEFPILNEGTQVTIRQLVESMIIQSDNTAYNTLLDVLDRRNINATLRNLGITETVVGEKLNLDDAQFQEDLTISGRQPNTTTAKDFATLFGLLDHNQIPDSDKILAIFKRQKINTMIPALLPPNTPVAHKSGDWAPIYHDGGIVYKPNDPFVLVVFTNSNDQSVLARIAKVAYDQNADAVGNTATVPHVVPIKTSEDAIHRYLADARTTAVLAAETKSIAPKVYVVQKGDSLWSIAEKFYKDGNRWTEITRRNFLPDTASAEPGMQLVIPDVSVTPATTTDQKFPEITAADLGVKSSDIMTNSTDVKKVSLALIAPGSPLYALKRYFESQGIGKVATNAEKVDAYLAASGRRLSEVKTLVANGDTAHIGQALSDSEADLQNATDLIKKNPSLSEKLSQVKQLTDLHYALFSQNNSTLDASSNKQQIVDALYTFYTQNQTHVAPVVQTSVAANPIQQQPLIGTVAKSENKTVTLQFDNGTTRIIPISQDTTVRDFHSTTPDTIPSLTVGSKIAVIGGASTTNTVQRVFILKNIPKELPDKHNGTVLDVNPQKGTIEILNKNGQREEIVVNNDTVVRGKDTTVSVGGITPGSQVTVFGENASGSATAIQSLTGKPQLSITLSPSASPTSASLRGSIVPTTHATVSIAPKKITLAVQPTQVPAKKTEPIIKATSITVTQNGTGKDVKQDSSKSITQSSQSTAKPAAANKPTNSTTKSASTDTKK